MREKIVGSLEKSIFQSFVRDITGKAAIVSFYELYKSKETFTTHAHHKLGPLATVRCHSIRQWKLENSRQAKKCKNFFFDEVPFP